MASKDDINLDFDDELKIACGQVFVTHKNLLILSCALCHEKYDTFPNFMRHLARKHFISLLIEAENDEINKKNAIALPKKESIDHSYIEVKSPLEIDLFMKDDPEFLAEPTKLSETYDDNNKECTEIEDSAKKEPEQIRTLRRYNRLSKTQINHEENIEAYDDVDKETTQHVNYGKENIEFPPQSTKAKKAYDDNDRETRQSEDSAGKEAEQFCTIRSYNKKIDVEEYHARKKYVCQICNAGFSYKSNLTAHKNRHTGIKSHGCELCEKKFFDRLALQVHVRTHTGERPFVCKTCSKKYISKSNLINHMLTHSAERKYVCEICNAAFKTNSGFYNHRKIHENRGQ